VLFFLKKIGSGTCGDPQFGRRRRGVSYIDNGKKGSRMLFQLVPFGKELTEQCSVVLPQKYS
jgi:hypothetical protein